MMSEQEWHSILRYDDDVTAITFGSELRRLLAAREMSYQALGSKIHYAKSMVAHWVARESLPSLDTVRKIDEVLGAGGVLVALAAQERAHSVVAGLEEDDMNRRALLAAMGIGVGAGVAGALPARSADAAYRAASADDWIALSWQYGYPSPTFRAALIDELAEDLAALREVMATTKDEAAQVSLAEAGGRLAGLLAHAFTAQDRQRDARHAWLTAKRYADASGSPEVIAWVRCDEAIAAMFQGLPPTVMVTMADEALRIPGISGTAGYGWLVAAKAQGLALAGDARGALDALRDVEDAPLVTGVPEMFGFGEHNVLWVRSFVQTLAGSADDARDAQDAAVRAQALRRQPTVTGRVQVELQRAAGMVREGDVKGGAEHASAALDGLRKPGRYVVSVAEIALSQVPTQHRQHAAVRELADVLAHAA